MTASVSLAKIKTRIIETFSPLNPTFFYLTFIQIVYNYRLDPNPKNKLKRANLNEL